ncbi:MAG: hypothetical protein NTZ28_04240 [Nitrospirae bacterium]|nr:hypothetical protein [Nitrospirota bacterium]
MCRPPGVGGGTNAPGGGVTGGGTGAVATTVNITGTVTGEAPVAFIVTVALWLPTVKVPVLTVSATAPFPVPEAGLSLNQAALSLAVQLSVPPPVLLMLTVWVAGLAPPCLAAKERLVGLAPMAGGATGGGATGGGVTGGGATGGGATGGGATGGGASVGMKVARLLSADSLFAKS